MPPGKLKRRVTGMCECSATHSESKPRSSSAAANSPGAIEYSVKKIAAPMCITALPAKSAGHAHQRRALSIGVSSGGVVAGRLQRAVRNHTLHRPAIHRGGQADAPNDD